MGGGGEEGGEGEEGGGGRGEGEEGGGRGKDLALSSRLD